MKHFIASHGSQTCATSTSQQHANAISKTSADGNRRQHVFATHTLEMLFCHLHSLWALRPTRTNKRKDAKSAILLNSKVSMSNLSEGLWAISSYTDAQCNLVSHIRHAAADHIELETKSDSSWPHYPFQHDLQQQAQYVKSDSIDHDIRHDLQEGQKAEKD